MPIKLALLDDHELVLEGIKNTLQKEPSFSIIGAFTKPTEFFQVMADQSIDIVILDMMLNGTHAFELIPRIHSTNDDTLPKIIMLSGFYEPLIHKRAFELGVWAFLRKEASYDELITTIKTVYHGNKVSPEHLFLEKDMRLLSEIERQVLELIAQEQTNEKIAKKLFISRRTVENHVSSICNKLNVQTRIGAVREGLKLNLIK